jgi:uncharacterized membrane protein YdjX (TVP38/TMEM64 family)
MENPRRVPLASVLYVVLLGVLPLLFSSTLALYVAEHEAAIRAFSPTTWVLIYAVSVLTMAFALTPTTLVALLSGYFLGWGAIVPVVGGYLLASALGFSVARGLDGGQLLAYFGRRPKVRAVLERLRSDEFRVIFFARLSPVLPFAITNVLFSFAGTTLRNFLLAGFLGMLPRTLLTIGIGTQGGRLRELLDDPAGITPAEWAVFGLLLVSLIGLGWVVRRAVAGTVFEEADQK